MAATHPTDYRTAEGQRTCKTAKLFIVEYNGTLYHFAGYDVPVVVSNLPAAKGSNPQTFAASGANDSGIDQSTDAPAQPVTVTVPVMQGTASAALRAEAMYSTPGLIRVWCYRVNSQALPTVDYDEDMWLKFHGLATGVTFGGGGIALECKPTGGTEGATVGSWIYQKLCQKALYGAACGVVQDSAAFRLSTTIAAASRPGKVVDIADTTLNSALIEQHVFQGGKLWEYTDGLYTTLVSQTAIIATEILPASAGVRLYLAGWSATMAAGRAVRVFRGCRRTITDCTDVFGNAAKFGGMPWIPVKNPTVDGV